ncbi:MAG TPA: NAD(P)-dependent alcohol dehydrogenase [Terracidiphilus sp.]|jgi:NADPH:quinone reductase-like Zn-dependent oxidoreductase
MKAIIYERYGSPDVLQFKEMAKPAPADNEVLIKVCAASVNPLDWHFMRGEPLFIRLILGLRKPKVIRLGVDVAGVVETVGRNVTQFKPGDAVFGGCRGAFAEYACAKEDQMVLKPASLSFEAAAAVPIAALTALQGLRDKGHIKPGHKVLIDGASGGVGTFAIQIAKALGAEVTAVCSTRNLDRAKSLGADHLIDYTREDFAQSGRNYDLILAANAYRSLFDYRRALSEDGICVRSGGRATLQSMFLEPFLSLFLSLIGRKKFCGLLAKMDKKDLVFLKDLLDAGEVVPAIDRRYPLSGVAEAIRYLEEGHAQGKVVITV